MSPEFLLNVIASIVGNVICTLSKYAYPTLKIWLIKTIEAFCEVCLKIYSSFKKISFPTVSKLNINPLIRGVGEILFSTPVRIGIGFYIFTMVVSHFGANRNTEYNTYAFATSQSSACYCPTPSDSVYTRTIIQPEWPQPSVPLNRIQPYCTPLNYSTTSISFTTDGTELLGDASAARKGRKVKRARKPRTIKNPPVVLGIGGSSNVIYRGSYPYRIYSQ